MKNNSIRKRGERLYLYGLPILLSYIFCRITNAHCILLWSLAQFWVVLLPTVEPYVFSRWEDDAPRHPRDPGLPTLQNVETLQIPAVDVRQFRQLHFKDDDDATKPEAIQDSLDRQFGKDWRKRPLLLRNIIDHNRTGRILMERLSQEELRIPYFLNAASETALSPDGVAPIMDILYNISQGKPHKIGSQLYFQKYPEFISQLAPPLLTELFGHHFAPQHLKSHFGLPPLTTVPLFVASVSASPHANVNRNHIKHPRTALHCEPIGNLAIQVLGRKQWTLIDSRHWKALRPKLSPDGRAYFIAQNQHSSTVPVYKLTTQPGDALWVPTWTWHRVDYSSNVNTDQPISIGASLFHFRSLEFAANNPLFASLILPALLQEIVGFKTQ